MNPNLEPQFTSLSLSTTPSSPRQSFVQAQITLVIPEARNIILQHLNLSRRVSRGPPHLLNPWIVARYGPLNFPNNLHDMPNNYLNSLPKYDGEKDITIEEHMDQFQDFANKLLIEDDDVYVRPFVQTLECEVRKWFRALPTNSLNS